MDELSLADLMVFARAAALGALSLAARERGVPVSQISRAVGRVENACGARLFRRSARGITLTQDGEAFLVFCQKVLETRNDLEADLSRSRRQVSGCVRVSLSSAIAQHWVVPSLPHLVEHHPQLGLDLLVQDGLVDLAHSGVDLAIRTGNPTALSLVARKLGEIETGLYASATYLDGCGTPTCAEDLTAHTLLANLRSPRTQPTAFRGWAAADGEQPPAFGQHRDARANGRRRTRHCALAGEDGTGAGWRLASARAAASVSVCTGAGVGADAPGAPTPATHASLPGSPCAALQVTHGSIEVCLKERVAPATHKLAPPSTRITP